MVTNYMQISADKSSCIFKFVCALTLILMKTCLKLCSIFVFVRCFDHNELNKSGYRQQESDPGHYYCNDY